VPEHGEYDPGLNQWYCSYWMSKELWMEIHDYSPPDPGEDSISPDGAFDPPSITENKQPKPTDEGHTKSETETDGRPGTCRESSNNNIFRSDEK
jgi:hypothetical protein